jgi:UDP-glucose 4-epimerase
MGTAKNILVTGGAGYIGSHTVVELINNGFTPVILDNFSNSHRSILDGINEIVKSDVVVREVDVCNIDQFKEVFAEFDFKGIIHFAAYKAVGESVEKPLNYYRNNILGLVNCLELAEQYNVQNIVFSSSCTVYGEPKDDMIVTEDAEMRKSNSPYGITKQIGEQIIQDVIHSGSKLKVLNLRYFNPIGAHESGLIGELPLLSPNNLLPMVTQTAIGKSECLMVHGHDYDTADGTCIRDYVHVSDVAEAHTKGLEWLLKQESGLVENINIGTGKGTSVLEIIHTFEEVSGVKLNWNMAERREGDIKEIYADVAKSKSLLNWQTKRTMRDAIKHAWQWELNLKND